MTPAAIVATILAGAFLAPTASAGPAEDLTAVVTDFAGDGDITSCRFSRSQLDYVKSQITSEVDVYAPDLRFEVDRELARWVSGGCGSSNTGQNGSQGATRATIKSVKVAKNRRSAKIKLRCPTAAASSCKVKLSGKLAGKKATKSRSATVVRGATKTVTVKLTKSATTRLKSKGGTLKISAKTTGSALSAATKTAKVATSA